MPSSDQIASASRPKPSRMRADERERPRGVHATAVRREDAQPPVADLVAEALDDQRPVGGDDARRRLLLGQEGEQVGGGAPVEVVVALQRLLVLVDGHPRERPDRLAELPGTPDALSVPEGHGARARPGAGVTTTRSRVICSMRQEVAPSRNVWPARASYTISSSSSPTRRPSGRLTLKRPRSGMVPALATARARAPGPRPDGTGDAVPDDPRTQLPELLRGIAAVEHVQHVLELAELEVRVGPRPPDQGVELVDRHALVPRRGGDRDDLLREHVERIARHHRRLDESLAHAPRHDGALEEVGAELGEDPSARHLAHAVAGAADPLQAPGHRLGRLHLHHEVDGAHVDAELERRGRDQAGKLPGLEQILDDDALLARQRAVVGARDLAHLFPALLRLAAGPGRSDAARCAPRRAGCSTKTSVERCSRTRRRSSG